jgi:hypothetical protein
MLDWYTGACMVSIANIKNGIKERWYAGIILRHIWMLFSLLCRYSAMLGTSDLGK